MRHIPEDELHAYLDQGLSRTQCVEIESHLADCPSCQAARDSIAALRDRTTALLARLAPPRGVPHSFDVLRERAAAEASERRRRLHAGAWAASLVAAMGLGYAASAYLRPAGRPEEAPGRAPAVASAPAPVPASGVAATGVAVDPPARTAGERRSPRDSAPSRPQPARASHEVVAPSEDSAALVRRAAALSVLNQAPAPELTRLDAPESRGDIELDGMWRTMSWDGANAESGARLPHIDGLPVVRVQVQSGELGARPVTVVAQQLASGQVIRTIEGPASDVSQLLSRQAMSDVDSLFLPGDTRGSGASHAMAMQLGDRMLAITGDLPSDSLRAMIRRLNAELRTK